MNSEVNYEKLMIAKFFSWLSPPIFGWAAYMDYSNGYELIAMFNTTVALSGPLCFIFFKIFQNKLILTGFALSVCFLNLVLIATTQMDKADNLLWVPLLPLVFIFFSNMVVGLSLCVVGLLVFTCCYLNWEQWTGTTGLSIDVFLQMFSAYIVAGIIAGLYEYSRQQMATSLRNEADLDSLTKIQNRRAFDRYLSGLIRKSMNESSTFSLVLFDIDNFKNINDSLGHNIGDKVLVKLADVAKTSLRGSDQIARWGGEEFILLLPYTNVQGAVTLAEKLRGIISDIEFSGVSSISASFGVTEYNPGDTNVDLITRADQALYRSKSEGKNRVRFKLLEKQSSVTKDSRIELSGKHIHTSH